MKIYTYYSTQRPVGIGTFPEKEKLLAYKDYGNKIYVDEIECWAWGELIYNSPLSARDMEEYELVQSKEQREEIEGKEVIKLEMAVTEENKSLGIDNAKATGEELISKLEEETKEVVEAIRDYENSKTLKSLLEIIRETYDLIQMCIVILWRCNMKSDYYDYKELLEAENRLHVKKLVKRKWKFGKRINIEVK